MYQTLFSFKKILFSFSLLSLFLNTLWADDFLAKLTNNALSDTSQGVKKLNLKEASEVVGGYYNVETLCYPTQCFAFADHKTSKNGISTLTARENVAINNVTFADPDLYLGYMSQKNWATSTLGRRYSYFTYAAVVLDGRTGRLYKQSSLVLNYNLVVLQLSNRFKDSFDTELGGLNP